MTCLNLSPLSVSPPGGRVGIQYPFVAPACLPTIRARLVRRTLNHHYDCRSFRLVTHTPLIQQSLPIPIRTAALFRKGANHSISEHILQSGPALPPPPRCVPLQRRLVNQLPPSAGPGLDDASKTLPSAPLLQCSAGISAAHYKGTVIPKHLLSGIASHKLPFVVVSRLNLPLYFSHAAPLFHLAAFVITELRPLEQRRSQRMIV